MDISFLLKRIIGLDYRAFFDVIDKLSVTSNRSRIDIFFDIVECGIKYQAGYMDYYLFRLDKVPKDKRSTFVTRGKNNHYVRLLNKREDWPLLEDKTKFYRLFKDYIKRDWLDLRTCSYSDFYRFFSTHDRFVVKPKDGTHGYKVEIINNDQDPKEVYAKIIANGQTLVEELIVQHDAIKHLYPYSVNTLRIVTIKHNGILHPVFACMRLGNGKDNVDNLNHGGIAVLLDTKKGELYGVGADRSFRSFSHHPVTNALFEGFKIPYFNEAMDMIKKASDLIPTLNYVGWDIAIKNDGPLLIEANHFPGHDIYQLVPHTAKDHCGIDEVFKKAMG